MSDREDSAGLSDKRLFERLVVALPRMFGDGSVNLRFSRGGALRASVVRENLPDVLQRLGTEKEQFDRAVSEVFVFLNGVIFEQDESQIDRMLTVGSFAVHRRADQETSVRTHEIRRRINLVREKLSKSWMEGRARLRQHSISPTYDMIDWSVNIGMLHDSDGNAVRSNSASVTLSLFRPAAGRVFGLEPYNITEIAIEHTTKTQFVADENDLDEMIGILSKVRDSLRRGDRDG